MSTQQPSFAILFDLDGTLTDAAPGITRCIQYALEKLGEVVPETDALRWCLGPPLLESFPKLLAHPDEQRVQQAIAYYRERYSSVGKFENQVYDGIPEMLDSLQNVGHRLYVATAKPVGYSREILEHFDLVRYFHGVFGSEMDGRRSNKADLIGYILETEQLARAESIMVGDRQHDILGANAQQIRSVGVLYGYGSREELTEAGATYLVDSPKSLRILVERLQYSKLK